MSTTQLDLESMLAALRGMSGMPSIGSLALNHAELAATLDAFDPIKALTACGGLLTVPQLQSNCLRLEALAHLAFFACNGNKKPQPKHLKQWFADLGQGPCGVLEDPAEDVFVGLVVTSRGNFRVICGTWEGATFYLQRIVNAVDEFPDSGRLGAFKESVYALLTLSDAVCQRAGLVRYELGNEGREGELADRFANTTDRLRQRVTFSRSELEEIGVDAGQLAEFMIDPARRGEVGQETMGNTLLERFPIAAQGSTLYLVLPTGVSTAIRRGAIELVDALAIRDKFLARLAAEYSRLIDSTPILGEISRLPLTIQSNANKNITSVMQAVDKGRYNIEQMMSMWLSRLAPVLDEALPTLPAGPVLLHTTFKGDIAALAPTGESLSLEEAKAEIAVSISPDTKTVSLVASERFQAAHYNERNVAERALVCCAIDGFVELAGVSLTEDEKNALIGRIVLNDQARQTHKFLLRAFRDYVQDAISSNPTMLVRMDGATSMLGLGWRIRDRKLGGDINGKAECIDYLNKLVRLLEDDLCTDLRRFNREAIVELALRTHESAALSKNQWERTASALLGLRDDQAAATAEIAKHGFQLNAIFLATRLLIEVALCECPIEGGLDPSKLDLTRLMSRAAAVPMYGGWSDAIRWDAMEPSLKIRPLGDVHAVIADFETLMESYARAGSDLRLAEAVENYGLHLQEPPINPTVEGVLEADFLAAWADEFGASFDDLRRFVDCIEDMAIKANEAVLKIPKSRLSTLSHETKELGPDVTAPLVESLILRPRQNWRDVPAGYDDRDRHPWRFRRRLSVLRKPLVQIDDKGDPTILIAPGMLRDSVGFMLSGYHRGDFPRWQLKPQMRQWAGRSSDRRGKEFNQEVAARLEALGWKVDTEVAMTKLLGMGLERNYGDVDVLAWHPDSGRVLIIECKDVQYRKTYGEISEQLADFRGELRPDGKPDYLRRHLDRVDLASKHVDKVKAYVKVSSEIGIESHLVFKHPVPMQFALKRLEERVSVHLASALATI